MYCEYWQLATKPFDEDLSGETYYPCRMHEGAWHKLRYAIEQRRSSALLAGPSGSGKTLLVQQLKNHFNSNEELASRYQFCHLVFPQMSGRDLLGYLANRLINLAANSPIGSVSESVLSIENSLIELQKQNIHPVLVIDEAQLLEDSGGFETLRLLTNFRTPNSDQAAFTILLVGQMGLLSSVHRWPTLDERLAVKTILKPFDLEETGNYLEYQLTLAGSSREIFDTKAVNLIHSHTGGIPRRINRLADLALVVGMAEELPSISAKQIESVQQELIGQTRAA